MTSIIQEDATNLTPCQEPTEILSIYHAMEQIGDRRRKQGQRYPLALVLTYLLLAKAAGETTLLGICEWIRLRGKWLRKVLPQAGWHFPCVATYSNVLRSVEAEELNQVLTDLLTRARATDRTPGEQQHVALDGKTLRGTQGHLADDQQKLHQVGLYETQTGLLLKEQVVADKENELSRIGEFVAPQWMDGRIVSADALHTRAVSFAYESLKLVETTYSSPKPIKRPYRKTCASFSRSRLRTAEIGAPLKPVRKGMGGSNSEI